MKLEIDCFLRLIEIILLSLIDHILNLQHFVHPLLHEFKLIFL